MARARFVDNPARLSPAGYRRALFNFQEEWSSYFRVALSEDLFKVAADACEKHRLRAYDGVHLVAALSLQQRTADQILVATWDRDLARAALAEGLSLANEVTP